VDVCLALGGGGIKGIAHLGVLECLEKAGYTVRAIAGTSAGGLVGAVYAAGYRPEEILDLLESLNKRHLYARRPADGPSLLGYAGLAEVLTEVLGECRFEDLHIPFACTAVDLRATRELYLHEGCVLDAVLATIAIPGIFPPKLRGDAELIDGAVLDPVPVSLARRLAPRLPVIAVVLNPPQDAWQNAPQFRRPPSVPLPIPTPLVEGFSHLRVGQAMRIFLESIDISACMLTELRLKADHPEVIIRPDVSSYGMLDVVEPRELVRAGYHAAEHALPQIRKALSWPNGLLRALRSKRTLPDGETPTLARPPADETAPVPPKQRQK
jgi:NTE family protein